MILDLCHEHRTFLDQVRRSRAYSLRQGDLGAALHLQTLGLVTLENGHSLTEATVKLTERGRAFMMRNAA